MLADANNYPTIPTYLVLLPRLSILYIREYSRVYTVGDPTGPYACMELPGIQIPHVLLTVVEDKLILCPFTYKEGNPATTTFASTTEIQPAKGWTSLLTPTNGNHS
jgi:hypothetical protein